MRADQSGQEPRRIRTRNGSMAPLVVAGILRPRGDSAEQAQRDRSILTALHGLLSVCALPLRRMATRAYAAGPALADAIELAQRFRRRGSKWIIGYWPGNETPRALADVYLAAIATLAAAQLDGWIAVKPSLLEYDRRLTSEVVRNAKACEIGVHFDSRSWDSTDPTLELVRESALHHPRIGCTLPGRWHRSLGDAERIAELDIGVRVVKGEWRDPTDPVRDAREGFLAIVDRLAGRTATVAVATHETSLARTALQQLLCRGTPCELQMLFGLPMRGSMKLGRELGVPMRMYVPYGHSRVPYPFSAIQHNPRVLGWIMRDVVFGRESYRLK